MESQIIDLSPNARQGSLDFFRGLAAFVMIGANAWPYLFSHYSCPFNLRIIFSTAAPIFILLNGASIALSIEKDKKYIYFVKRGIQLFLIGCFIDIYIWNLYPIYTMDILYLISLSMVFIPLLRNINKHFILVIGLFFLFTNKLFKYEYKLVELEITDRFSNVNLINLVNNIFIDGWFPIFPWLGVAIIGFYLYGIRTVIIKSKYKILAIGLTLITYYISTNNKVKIFNSYRNGYTELFYPVDFNFTIFILGISLIMMSLLNFEFPNYNILKKYGSVSMPIYLIHNILIKFYLPLFYQSITHFNYITFTIAYFSYYIILTFFVLLISSNLDKIKYGKFWHVGKLIGL